MTNTAHNPVQTLDYPAPWTLTGDGLILAYRPDRAWRARRPDGWSGRLAFVMWVDYRTTPVGPYREWLLIPGRRENPRGRHYSISDIWVDSGQSLVGGQQNWGIPKQLAAFDWSGDRDTLRVSMRTESAQFSLAGVARGPTLPVWAGRQPFTLYQQRGGRHFWYRPGAHSRCRWFSVTQAEYRSQGPADLGGQKLVAAFLITGFTMTFPPAITA